MVLKAPSVLHKSIKHFHLLSFGSWILQTSPPFWAAVFGGGGEFTCHPVRLDKLLQLTRCPESKYADVTGEMICVWENVYVQRAMYRTVRKFNFYYFGAGQWQMSLHWAWKIAPRECTLCQRKLGGAVDDMINRKRNMNRSIPSDSSSNSERGKALICKRRGWMQQLKHPVCVCTR